MDQYSLENHSKSCTSLYGDDMKIVLFQLYSMISKVRADGVLVIDDAGPLRSPA